MSTKILGNKSVGLMLILVMFGNLMLVPMVHQARADQFKPGADGRVEKAKNWGWTGAMLGGLGGLAMGKMFLSSGLLISGALTGGGGFLFLGPLGWTILAGAAAGYMIARLIQNAGQNLGADLHNQREERMNQILGVPMGGAANPDPR